MALGFTSRPLLGPPSSITPDDPRSRCNPAGGASSARESRPLGGWRSSLWASASTERGGPRRPWKTRGGSRQRWSRRQNRERRPSAASRLGRSPKRDPTHSAGSSSARLLPSIRAAQAAPRRRGPSGQPGDAPMADALRQLAAPAIGAAAVDVAVARAALKGRHRPAASSAAAASPAVDAATRLRATLALVEASTHRPRCSGQPWPQPAGRLRCAQRCAGPR